MKRRQTAGPLWVNYVLCSNLLGPLSCAKAPCASLTLKHHCCGVIDLKLMLFARTFNKDPWSTLSFSLQLIISADRFPRSGPTKRADKTMQCSGWYATKLDTYLYRCRVQKANFLRCRGHLAVTSRYLFTAFKYKTTVLPAKSDIDVMFC